MFYNRTSSFDKYLKQLKFKQEYIDLANAISSSIGGFSGVHLRQTDFAQTIYRTGRAMINRQMGLLTPFLDTETICQ